MTKPIVLAPDSFLSDWQLEHQIINGALEIVTVDELDADRVPAELWRGCDAVLVWHRMKLTNGVIERLERCRQIVRVGVGFDNVDVDACNRRGIPVCNVPNYGTTDVADHAVGMLLNLTRGLQIYQSRLRADAKEAFLAWEAPVVRRLRGETFGAIGMGRIGTAIARRMRAFDMNVVFYDPYLPEGQDLALGFRRVRSLHELLEQSDVVSVHVPLSAKTRNLIGHAEVEAMREGSVLLNIARGGLVDLDAVEHGLRSGRISAAGLDVLPQEPPVDTHPLLSAWTNDEEWLRGRLVVTPHIAFYSPSAYRDMRTFSVEILRDYLLHGRLRNNVNPGWESAAKGLMDAV